MDTSTTGPVTTGNGVRGTVVDDEIDLTANPLHWVAPGSEVVVRAPEPEPAAAEPLPSVADHRHQAWPLVLGLGAVLLIMLLSSLLGIMFNRVDDLEHEVDRLQKTVQQN